MENQVKYLRVFHYPAEFAAGRACSTEFPMPGDADKIGMEILCRNPRNETRDLDLKFRCYQLSGNQSKPVWKFEDKIALVKGRPEARFDKLCLEILDIGHYQSEVFIEGKWAGYFNFRITESVPQYVPIEVSHIKLYEAAGAGNFELSRQFCTSFDVAQTRFICVECLIRFRPGETTGESVNEHLEFHFKNQQGETLGFDRRAFSILSLSNIVPVRGGWGHSEKGLWEAGDYEVWVLFRGKLLQKLAFDCYHQEQVVAEDAEAEFSKQLSANYLDLNPCQLSAFPEEIKDQLAVILAYKGELDKIADYIRHGLSVLISCDKNLVEYLYEYIYTKAGKTPLSDHAYDRELLLKQMATLNKERILIIRSLDLLDDKIGTFILYHTLAGQTAQILAFMDSSANLNSALVNRFHVRTSITGLPKRIFENYIPPSEASKYAGLDIFGYIVTKRERACFKDEENGNNHDFGQAIHKQVASLNVIQFRRAMQYIGSIFPEPMPYKDIFREIRQFKTNLLGDDIGIPETTFDDIGGYSHIKAELNRMLNFLADQKEQKKKAPKFKGFVFHGPPGTGKTLFAKAIANELNATIQMISGPEIIEKWVGESEANLRRIFNVARRNAPSVILFDEFDSIARKRSQSDDGGARAGNSLMAQILTELDGFREEDGVLVIGTTNQLNLIDTALLRPSRLTPIKIDLPDAEGRKRVAEIHARESGTEELAKNTFKLVLEHLQDWDGQSELPEKFLTTLFEANPKTKTRMEQEADALLFRSEVRDFYGFVKKVQDNYHTQNDAALQQVTDYLSTLAQKYRLKLEDGQQPSDTSEKTEINLFTAPQRDILSLFRLVETLKETGGEVSPETYFSTLIDLVAEYSDGFNNDEIRAVFQEISIDCHSRGQVVTPRYVGQQIGLVQKRKTEKPSKS